MLFPVYPERRFLYAIFSILLSVFSNAIFAAENVGQTMDSLSENGKSATQVQFLSGKGPNDTVQWDFFCTGGRNSRTWGKIGVPSCWETQGYGTFNYGGETVWGDGPIGNEQGLYRRTFDVPLDWKDKTVRLVFDAVMTDTSVWINGESAGATHHGGFYRFSYDITKLLHFGASNKIEVTVSKVSALRSINDAERAADFWIFGGIFRPVWLEATPHDFIEWTAIDAKADGKFAADIHLGDEAKGTTGKARISTLSGSSLGTDMIASVDDSGRLIHISGSIPNPAQWTAETPTLYQVDFQLLRGAEVVHAVKQRFGFRTIEVRENDGVYLNGTKIILKGINRHCFSPETGRTVSREQSYADARLIKEANMNAVRMSHYPPDVDFLEACDELGLYALDELTGWQKAYHAATGKRLIGELIRRDVNHPSILFWDNGNEGGWNVQNDGEFANWDPQHRTVLHPWELHGGINTKHYPKYEMIKKLSAGPTIFMPTEFLHGLYDGGIGAGFHDYWEVMGKSPTVAGGFFWTFLDEGVVRNDENGRIDNHGNEAPDGMLGPHREKEGSYFTVKEIWSPVEVLAPANGSELPAAWDGMLLLKNHYAFTSLKTFQIEWSLLRFTDLSAANKPNVREKIASGSLAVGDIAPNNEGRVNLGLPANWREGAGKQKPQALQVVIKNPEGQALFTWSWRLSSHAEEANKSTGATGVATIQKLDHLINVTAGATVWHFDRETGLLSGAEQGHKSISLSNGPRVVAYHRTKKEFSSVGAPDILENLDASVDAAGRAIILAKYKGALNDVKWIIDSIGATVDFSYSFDGLIDILGVEFDYPESFLQSKQWLGRGPYRVYQNRLQGGIYDVWNLAYNDPIPGQTYSYPEFKGFFNQWDWLALTTTEGILTVKNLSAVPYFDLYRSKEGIKDVLQWPPMGLAFLEVISAQGTKFDPPDLLGPQSQTREVKGPFHGTLRFEIATKKSM